MTFVFDAADTAGGAVDAPKLFRDLAAMEPAVFKLEQDAKSPTVWTVEASGPVNETALRSAVIALHTVRTAEDKRLEQKAELQRILA